VIDEQDGLQAFVLRFENGAKIVAGSSNPKFFRGKGGDADGDEFAFHGQPRELFKAMQPTAMFWGHQMRLWSTHNGEGSYFNFMIKEARAGRLKAEVQTVTILDAVEQGLVEKIKRLRPATTPPARSGSRSCARPCPTRTPGTRSTCAGPAASSRRC
jgi:phage FluMu gp28-like protein